MADIIPNSKKINRFVGEKTRTVKDIAYTKDDRMKMLRILYFKTMDKAP